MLDVEPSGQRGPVSITGSGQQGLDHGYTLNISITKTDKTTVTVKPNM